MNQRVGKRSTLLELEGVLPIKFDEKKISRKKITGDGRAEHGSTPSIGIVVQSTTTRSKLSRSLYQ